MQKIEYQQLPEELDTVLDDILDAFYEKMDAKDFSQAESLILDIWDQLPDPKLTWDFYANIIPRKLTDLYIQMAQFDKAYQWLDVTRESYGPEPDVSIEFLAGRVHFHFDQLDQAFDRFKWCYDQFKKRPFQEEDPEYWSFFEGRLKNGS